MDRLWVRLTLAFALVSLVGLASAAFLADRQLSAQFRGYVANSQMLESGIGETLADYYAQTGSWEGVEVVLSDVRGPGSGPPAGAGRGAGAMRRGAPNLVIADASGAVVYGGSLDREPRLTDIEREGALPLRVNGQLVGYVTNNPAGRMDLSASAQAFLAGVNRSLLQAGLAALLIGVLLGFLIARNLAAPLAEMGVAARRLAAGDLTQRAPVTGAAEVKELATAFNDMAGDLERSETLRRNMVADIAHELRTPLSVVQGNLRAILDDVYPLTKEEIAVVYDETQVLNRLIADLRELAQAEAGQLSLTPRALDLGALVAGETTRFGEAAQAAGVTLTVEVAPGLPPVVADADRTRQVIHNLLSNALRYTAAGGRVHVSAAGDGQTTTTGVYSVGDPGGVRVSVADSGVGIAPDDLPYVFNRFWRADRSRSRGQGGSGLGLAIARHLVEAQGGQIGVVSEPGKGSLFWFRLPSATATAQGDGA